MRFLIIFYLFFLCIFAAELENNSASCPQYEAITLAQNYLAKVNEANKKNKDIERYLAEAKTLMQWKNYSKEDAVVRVEKATSLIEEQAITIPSLTESLEEIQTAFSIIKKIEMYHGLRDMLLKLGRNLDYQKIMCCALEKSLGLKVDKEFGLLKHSDGDSSEELE